MGRWMMRQKERRDSSPFLTPSMALSRQVQVGLHKQHKQPNGNVELKEDEMKVEGQEYGVSKSSNPTHTTTHAVLVQPTRPAQGLVKP